MREPDGETKLVCASCVTEGYLQSLIEAKPSGSCSYCEKAAAPCFEIDDLADLVEEAFESHFRRTPSEPSDYEYALIRDREISYDWSRGGTPVLDVIVDIASCEQEVGEDLLEILQDRHGSYDPSDPTGDEDEFSPESYYERRNVNSDFWQVQWHQLEMALKYESRLFNQEVLNLFQNVFAGLEEARTHHGGLTIVEAGPGTELLGLYRAREFQSQDELKKALEEPVKKLGPPAGPIARANRMNSSGISVFYGAKDAKSALAEVRPAVGSQVVVAQFMFTRPLRLLDLRSLESITCKGSLFDPVFVQEVERIAFLRTLARRLTLPVMPGDQDHEYLITQAVADYLASLKKPLLDGIIFPSVQDGVGENVVLFHKASLIEHLPYPHGTRLSSSLLDYEPETDEGYPSFSIHITQPKISKEDKRRLRLIPLEPDWEFKTEREPALRLLIDSIVVHTVKAVEVHTSQDRVFISHGTAFERADDDGAFSEF